MQRSPGLGQHILCHHLRHGVPPGRLRPHPGGARPVPGPLHREADGTPVGGRRVLPPGEGADGEAGRDLPPERRRG